MQKLLRYKKLVAALSYFFFLVFIPIIYRKEDKFIIAHAKQGLMLFFLEIVALVWTFIPVIGKLTAWILWTFIALMIIIGIVQAARGKKFIMPWFGKTADRWIFHGDSLLP